MPEGKTLAHELALLPINYQAQGKTFAETVTAIEIKLEPLVKALEAVRDLNPFELSRHLHAKHRKANRPEPTPDEAIVETLCKVEELAKAALAAARRSNG
jgi:hypothetical protein